MSSVFFTVGGARFYATAIMLVVGLGAAEQLYGTSKTIALFWGIHLATLLLGSLLLAFPLHAFDVHHGTLLVNARDVGPSAGYYGCLGAACNAMPSPWRFAIVGIIVLILATRLIWSITTLPDQGRTMSADLSHIIAFPLGLLAATLIAVAQRDQQT